MPEDRPLERCEQAQPDLPHFVLHDGTILDFTPGHSWIVGRATPAGDTVDIDLAPYGGAECGVSRRHARIDRVAEGFTIEDLQSHNETAINRLRISPCQRYPLAHGDRLALGALQLTFVLS
jgi:pSer/pThr/pTyr-binding forkhead associated (FHA) protein